MSNQQDKAKSICTGTVCSFKPVVFSTFEYMYCSECKCEVTEALVERKAHEKALLSTKTEHSNTEEYYIDYVTQNNKIKRINHDPDDDYDNPFYPYDLFTD